MAQIFIDGYNLIGTQRGNLASEREALIEAIIAYAKRMEHHDITLVFDGYIDGGHESVTIRGGVRLMYTGLGERADDAIIRMLPRGVEAIVVSSDRQVQAGAFGAGAVAVSSDAFIAKLNSAGADGDYDDDDADYDDLYAERSHKGNSHRASKKDKAVQRGLSKL